MPDEAGIQKGLDDISERPARQAQIAQVGGRIDPLQDLAEDLTLEIVERTGLRCHLFTRYQQAPTQNDRVDIRR